MTTKTFKIVKNNILGCYMVANVNLKQGEIILKEKPVFVGPQLNGPTNCFRCNRNINLLSVCFCNECNVALVCKNNCNGSFHSNEECGTFKDLNINGELLAENSPVIFPFRCLLLKKYNIEMFEKVLKLEPHFTERKNTAIWRRNRISVQSVLEDMQLLEKSDLDEELVQKICGILDVNTFEVRQPHSANISITNPEIQCLRGLYLKAAMMAHDCMANVHLSVDDDFNLIVRASVNIKENETIYFNYANVLQGNQERQRHLQEGKYFKCKCKRCLDPSEFGTEISSLRCHKCRKGLLRLKVLDESFKIWQCIECKSRFKEFLMDLAVEEGKRKIDDVDQDNIQEMESLYKKLALTFHPNHYLLLELKQNMVGLYSKLSPTKINLNRKIDLCGRLLSVFTKLEPGLSRIRAITMYELQSAIVDLSNKQYRDQEINEEVLVCELSSAEAILKEAVKYLLYEPSKSPEGRLAQMALYQLKMLRSSIKNIREDFLLNEDHMDIKQNAISKRLKKKVEKKKDVVKNNEKQNGVESVTIFPEAKVVVNNGGVATSGKSGKRSRKRNK